MKDQYSISVILPVYNEGAGIYKNTLRIHEVLTQYHISHQFILVDDGSQDQSWEQIKKLKERLPVKALRFSRNFGKESALMAALDYVTTPGCVMMDADLQHPPEVIVKMAEKWRMEGYDIIEGVKVHRGKERLINKIGAGLFYRVFSRFSGFELKNASDFKFFDRKVIQALQTFPEKQMFFRGLTKWVGFKSTQLEFEVQDRQQGSSNWSLWGLFKLALLAITSFSSIPLHLVTMMGFLFFVGSFVLGIQTLYMKFSGHAVDGFTTVILLLLIIGSTLMISLGIIGVYIGKIFHEVKNRPRYIISEIIETPIRMESIRSQH